MAGLDGLFRAAAWSLTARAQSVGPVIGFVAASSAAAPSGPVAAIHLALRQAGYEVGQNVRMEYRYADNRLDRLPALVADLVKIPASVIITSGGPATTLAAKAATTSIPIVFAPVADPVGNGIVASLNRPGGNITGVAALTVELDPKRLDLLHELTPSAGPWPRPSGQNPLFASSCCRRSYSPRSARVARGQQRRMSWCAIVAYDEARRTD